MKVLFWLLLSVCCVLGLLSMIHSEITNDIAADPIQFSSKAALIDTENSWDDAFVHGYMQLAQQMATGLDIRTGSRVVAIDYQSTGVNVTYNSGDTMKADYVVVTVPLWVLKKWAIQFRPSLPFQKQEAIDWLDMGVLTKTFLEFDHVFWTWLQDKDFIRQIDDPQGVRPYWLNVYKYSKKPVLLGFNGWQYAKQLELKSDQEIIQEAMKSLEQMFGRTLPQPTHYLISRWSRDENSYWSYSYIPVGALASYYDDLAASVDDKIFFAGEATHRSHHSTVLGAYLSGKREAKKIINLEKNK